MPPSFFTGKRALVTGASSGIGESFARALAHQGTALLLTSLPGDLPRLQEIGAELARQHGIHVETLTTDLSVVSAAQQLQAAADACDFEPDLLVNNAGVGSVGRFVDLPLDRQLATIRVNIEALVTLTGLYLPRMVGRPQTAIVNVASTAAFQPLPYFAVYAASKAFVLNFSEALWAEHHRDGVRIVAVCPGPVAETGFNPNTGMQKQAAKGLWGVLQNNYLSRDSIVAATLDAIERDQPRVVRRVPVIGLGYYPLAAVGSLMPRRLYLRLTERLSILWTGAPAVSGPQSKPR